MGNPFEGSAGSPSSNAQNYQQMLQAYTQYLPQISQETNAQATPTAQALVGAEQAVTPEQNALNLQQLQQFALPTAQVGSAVQNQSTLLGSGTQLQDLAGPGGAAALYGSALNRAANVPYSSTIANSANQSNNLLNAINVNGLSPGEYNSTERAVNQGNQASGNLGLFNGTNTLSNALNFGGAFNTKLGILGNAIGTANNTANAAENNGFNAIGTAFSQPGGSSSSGANTQFQTTNPTGSTIAQPLLSSLTGLTQANIAPQAQSAYQNSPQGSYVANASSCCFIFMEAYHGILPPWVRECRDRYYSAYPQIAKGYKKMAKWLVPLMHDSNFVRAVVWATMIAPLTEHGAWVKRLSFGVKHRLTRKFWFTIWNYLGKD
jgi:hypothetical protein